jgi:hypothetical protein
MGRSQIVGNSGNTAEVASDGSQLMQLTGSNMIQPTEIQSRYATTIQTHNAVSVGASSSSNSSWIDCDGFTDLAITLKNDAVTTAVVDIDWSHDGTTQHGRDISSPIPSGTGIVRSATTPIKGRYARISVFNGDTISHTMSAWAYLKA